MIEFSLARPSEAQIIALTSRALIEYGLTWSWTPERVAKQIRCPDTMVLVAREQQRLIGFAIMYFGEIHAHLNLLGIKPSHQHRGIGKGLVDWLEQSARVAGIANVHLEVRAGNAVARRFYRSLGYWEVLRIPGYYEGREAALRMHHDLHAPRRIASD